MCKVLDSEVVYKSSVVLNRHYLRARYYNQNVGRFTQMDTWMGVNDDPVTLHKYLYANVDPVNMVDPTGKFATMGGFSAGMVGLGVLATGTYIAYQSGNSKKVSFGSSGSLRQNGLLFMVMMMGPSGIKMFNMSSSNDLNSQDKLDAQSAGQAEALSQTDRLDRKNRRAVIGEDQEGRVLPAARDLKAITIRFRDPYRFEGKLTSKQQVLSIAFNYGWIKTLRVNNFEIYDIGRAPDRVLKGQPISPWYAIEAFAVKGYEKHYKIKWP